MKQWNTIAFPDFLESLLKIEAYSESNQTYKIKLFAKIANNFQPKEWPL